MSYNPVGLSPQQQQAGIKYARGRVKLIPSSWIRAVDYDMNTGRLDIKMNQKWYSFHNVSVRNYQKFINAKVSCVTDDPTGQRRWWKGKKPSLGAAYHRYIKTTGGPSLLRRFGAKLTQLGRRAKRTYQSVQNLGQIGQNIGI
jgi:hypothetical protein